MYLYAYIMLINYAPQIQSYGSHDLTCDRRLWHRKHTRHHSWCDGGFCSPDTAGSHCWDQHWSGTEKKGTAEEERNAAEPGGSPGENRSTNATEEDGTKNYTYYNVGDDTSNDKGAVLYQGLGYVSMYTKLRGGTYQELDLKGREEEHHYQTTHREKGTWKK